MIEVTEAVSIAAAVKSIPSTGADSNHSHQSQHSQNLFNSIMGPGHFLDQHSIGQSSLPKELPVNILIGDPYVTGGLGCGQKQTTAADDGKPSDSLPYSGTRYLLKTPYGALKVVEIGLAVAIIVFSVIDVGDWFTLFIASFQLAASIFVLFYNVIRTPCMRWAPNMLLDFFLVTASTLLLMTGGTLVGSLWPHPLSELVILLPLIFSDAFVSLIDTGLTLRRYFQANDCALFYYRSSDNFSSLKKSKPMSKEKHDINEEAGVETPPSVKKQCQQHPRDILAVINDDSATV